MRVDQLPPTVRTRVLAELAAARTGVRAVVLTLPDRHGGPPHEWWQVARELSQGPPELTVLVTCTPSSAHVLGVEHVELGGQS